MNYEEGDKFESWEELIKWVAAEKPYYRDGDLVNHNCITYYQVIDYFGIYRKAIPVKSKRKVTMYRHTVEHQDGTIQSSNWTSTKKPSYSFFTDIIHTESKTIKVDAHPEK